MHFLACFEQHSQGESKICFKVAYVSNQERQGRLYAQSTSAQRLPRPVRALLFGQDHVEIDLISAHLSTLFLLTTGHHTFQGLSAAEWRQGISEALKNTAYVQI